MSYTKTTWQNGDIITAEKLNNIENGISIEPVYVNMTYDEQAEQYVSDKTFGEVRLAYENHIPIYIIWENEDEYEGFTHTITGISYTLPV